MYKSRAFKVEPVTRKGHKKSRSTSITINGKTWQVRNKIFRKNWLSIEFRHLLIYSLNKQHPLAPAQCSLMLFLTIFVFCKKKKMYVNYTQNAKRIKINNKDALTCRFIYLMYLLWLRWVSRCRSCSCHIIGLITLGLLGLHWLCIEHWVHWNSSPWPP